MAIIRILGPAGLTEDEFPQAELALQEVGAFNKATTKGLLKALLDTRIMSLDISSGIGVTEGRVKLKKLRQAHLLARIMDAPFSDPEPEDTLELNDKAWESWQ